MSRCAPLARKDPILHQRAQNAASDQAEAADQELTEMQRATEAQQRPKLDAAQDEVTRAQSKAADLRIWLQQFPATDDYLLTFSPTPVKKTLTDADGRFSIAYPPGKAFTLYAKAQRLTQHGTEHYCWLLNAPMHPGTEPFFLSNNNLTQVDADGYFKLKPHEPEKAVQGP